MGLADKLKSREDPEAQRERQQRAETERAASDAVRAGWIAAGQLFEYKVEQVRQSMIGDKVKVDDLEALLNRYAALGWHVRTITETAVAGRVGPGGTGGLVVVFERLVTA